MLPLFKPRAKDANGCMYFIARSGAIAASLSQGEELQGWANGSGALDGWPYVTDVTGSVVPSTAKRSQGVALTPDGALYVTSTAPSSTSVRVCGIAVTQDGAVHVAGAGSTRATTVNGLALTASGQVMLAESFDLPLSDAGSGVVNIVPLYGAGSATFTRNTTAYTRLSTGLWALVSANQPRSIYSAAGVYLGYQAEGARADVLGTTDAIRRTMADAGWVAGATMTKSLAVGMDGVADAAACMTGGAVEATNTVLFTTVLASAARTFGVWVRRKTGTGVVRMTDNGGTNWTDITLTTTYTQFQVTRTQANPVVGFQIATNLDAIEIDFNTIEAAAFANPTPIPVNVSKAADILTYPLAGNIALNVGTVTYTMTDQGGLQNSAGVIGDGGAVANLTLSYTINGGIRFQDGTNTVDGPASVTPVLGVSRNVGVSYGGATALVAASGAVASGSFDGLLSITSNIGIATVNGAASGWVGALKNITISKSAASSAQLAVLAP